MQQAIRCPICGDIMMTEFESSGSMTKKCYKHPSHWVRLTSAFTSNEIYKIQILVQTEPIPLYATWHFLSKELRLAPRELSKAIGQPLPWFEPDLSDYRRLIEKIKTYVTFS